MGRRVARIHPEVEHYSPNSLRHLQPSLRRLRPLLQVRTAPRALFLGQRLRLRTASPWSLLSAVVPYINSDRCDIRLFWNRSAQVEAGERGCSRAEVMLPSISDFGYR